MKLFRKILSVFSLAALFIGSMGSGLNADPNFKTYTSKDDGFSISLPAAWMIKEKFMGCSMAAVRPLITADDKSFRENINVVCEKLDPAMSSDDYLKATLPMMKKFLNHFQQIEIGDAPSNFQVTQGKYLIYTQSEDPTLKVIVYIFAKKGRGFDVTCSTTPDKFKEFLPLFQTLVQSFKAN